MAMYYLQHQLATASLYSYVLSLDHEWQIHTYVTGPEKIGLIYIKYTFIYYGA